MINHDLEKFWKKKSELIHWFQKPSKIITKSDTKNFIFYKDGKTNIAYNCIKKNIEEGNGEQVAIILIDKENNSKKITYNELENLVDHFIENVFLKFKIKDLQRYPIAINSSANFCSVISMLSCMKYGLTHCVIFEDLSKEAIEIRCKLIKCKILICSLDNTNFKNKILPIKKKLKLKIVNFSNTKQKYANINILSDVLLKKKKIKKYHKYKKINSNKASFILFTSGSTGEPKGIIHSTGGYLVYAKYTCLEKFQINYNKIILTASDAGWINGHTYALYGPLSCGATTIILEKPMNFLDSDVQKKILFNYKVSILYLPVTILRLIKSIRLKQKIKSKHLKLLGSMGEPMSKYVGRWFSNKFSFKSLQIVNTYFQTETGGIIAAPGFKDSIKNTPFGTVGKPLSKKLGVFIDQKMNSEIKIKNPWPGCMIGVINGNSFFDKYWDDNCNFKLFDFASIDKYKNFLIHGRLDDVINVRGHRIGSGEIESVLLKSNKIKEVCAIGVDDKLAGNEIVIFVVKKSKNRIDEFIENSLLTQFGTFALPKKIIYLSELPKTRSGKILRRLLRNIYNNYNTDNLGDISTISNKNIIDEIKLKLKANE